MEQFVADVGDIVELNLTMYSSFDVVNEFGSGQVVDIFEKSNQIEVLMSRTDEIKTFAQHQVIDIEREFKVIQIIDNIDNRTKQPLIIIQMSRIEKLYMNNFFNVIRTYNPNKFDTFIFYNESIDCLEICNNPEENKFIRLSKYRLSKVNDDGVAFLAHFLDE